jgi:4'-phosphopantetheinyl transferase
VKAQKMKIALDRSEAHLWVVRPEEIRDPGLLRTYEELLTDEERKKRDRFRFAKDRHQCLVTRALVRSVLSLYADVPPDRWRFDTNEYGRPDISEPRTATPLEFNLSHTSGLIVCLVANNRSVGVDVEDRHRRGKLLDVAHRFFSPFEVHALRSLPNVEQLDRFFLYWTLKESYIKARGMGLAIPLSHFSFDLDDISGRGIRIFFDPRLEDDPESWQFSILSYGRRHVVATSIRKRAGETVTLRLRETVPLCNLTGTASLLP